MTKNPAAPRGDGAPGNKIEITPEMIRAGAKALMRDDRVMISELCQAWAEAYAEDVLRAALGK